MRAFYDVTCRQKLKRLLPFLVVAVVLLTVGVSVVNYNGPTRVSFTFNTYWPPPSEYYPGEVLPNAFLQINYTSSGIGNYTYVVTYSTTSQDNVVGRGSVLVSKLSPYTAYFNIPVIQGESGVAQAIIYKGSETSGQVVYTKSISF